MPVSVKGDLKDYDKATSSNTHFFTSMDFSQNVR